MDKRREIYDALCRTLTDYEEGAAGGRDLYRMLCEIQRRWEDTITVQDLTCGWSHHENVLKDPADILNTFRNRYYADGCSTENGIVANAINDILPRMILPPCKIGTHLWRVTHPYRQDPKVTEFVVKNFRTTGKKHLVQIEVQAVNVPGTNWMRYCDFHKTKEEAERELAERTRQWVKL